MNLLALNLQQSCIPVINGGCINVQSVASFICVKAPHLSSSHYSYWKSEEEDNGWYDQLHAFPS